MRVGGTSLIGWGKDGLFKEITFELGPKWGERINHMKNESYSTF